MGYVHLWFHLLFDIVLTSILIDAASSSFMTDAKFPEGRKLLALYPVLLFYLSLSWMVLIGFQRGAAPTTAVAQAANPRETVGAGASSGAGAPPAHVKPAVRLNLL